MDSKRHFLKTAVTSYRPIPMFVLFHLLLREVDTYTQSIFSHFHDIMTLLVAVVSHVS